MTARTAAGVGVAVVSLALAFLLTRRSPPEPGETKAATSAARPAPEPAGGETPAHFRPLLGPWLRPDGGYVLEVRAVAADGRATVAYFNPRPIRVARAEGRREGDVVGLFVEFDDERYRGSTYLLAWDAGRDELRGVYHQAMLGQRFEVAFTRRR